MPNVQVRGVEMKHLSTKEWWTTLLGLVFTLTLFTVGCVGLYCLTDLEQQSWLAQTQFAQYYYFISQKFVFLTAAFVNGGMVGVIFCAARLYGHSAKKAEAKAIKKKK